MKILNVNQIREADAYTIEHEPIRSIDLMERAGGACISFIIKHLPNVNSFAIIAGPGNNGGDGLVIARLLSLESKKVFVYIFDEVLNYSADFRSNLNRLEDCSEIQVIRLSDSEPLPDFQEFDVVIDAIFGSGLNKVVIGFFAKMIEAINRTSRLIISIDVPSGLFADFPNDEKSAIVRAHLTLSLQFPKFMMLMPENHEYVGDLHIIPIGLHEDFINAVKPEAILLEDSLISGLLKKRKKYDHKGNFGHALLIAGSRKMSGAAVLAASACLRSGAGLVTVHTPDSATLGLRASLPEAMLSIDSDPEVCSQLPDIQSYNSIAMGPGLGTSSKSATALKLLIQNSNLPLVLDADALNILSENKTWLAFLPKGSILTPHIKEFDRLAGKSENHFDRIQKQKELSRKFNIYIVLKGAHSVISFPDGQLFFNNTGNPGMATGGSGDVLTGILAGLFAQGYSSSEASLLGVYIHGLAGDLAIENQSVESLIASDIVRAIGKAFNYLHNL